MENREREALKRLIRLEGLAGRKAEIYAKLLTDQALAASFFEAAQRHTRRKQMLEGLLGEDQEGGTDDEQVKA